TWHLRINVVQQQQNDSYWFYSSSKVDKLLSSQFSISIGLWGLKEACSHFLSKPYPEISAKSDL
ncbi:MAG: hypothetical protein AAF959_29825, partial [Cyanobacteria bacterium P01_D01_bin.56]